MIVDNRRRWPPRRVLDETTRPRLVGDAAATDVAALRAKQPPVSAGDAA